MRAIRHTSAASWSSSWCLAAFAQASSVTPPAASAMRVPCSVSSRAARSAPVKTLDSRQAATRLMRTEVSPACAASLAWMSVQKPQPHFQKYGENLWAAVRGYLDAVADAAAAPVIKKYTGVLGAADVFTAPTAFSILESIRLDL